MLSATTPPRNPVLDQPFWWQPVGPDDLHRHLLDGAVRCERAATGILDGTRDATTGAINAAGTFSVTTLNVSALTDSAADLATIDGYIKGADAAINELTAGATTLGASKARVEMQKTFVSSLIDSLDSGIGQLVDADMNEESTRLQALQVKQQLGIQSLSIANQSSQSILRLFQ